MSISTSTSPRPPRGTTTIVLGAFGDLLGAGLRELIHTDPSLEIVAVVAEHERISVVLQAHHPDVALLDIVAFAKPAEIRDLGARHPATRLVLLGGDFSSAESAQLMAFGASACLARETQSRDVLNAIHLASRGMQLAPRGPGGGQGAVMEGLLTPREAEVLPLLQQGNSNAQIALALQVGVETVRTHARNIYRKLGVSSRRELVAPAMGDREGPVAGSASPRRRSVSRQARRRRGHGTHRA